MPTDTVILSQRETTRFPPDVASVAMRFESFASVVDESHGGIAVDLFSAPLQVGKTVQVEYGGAPMLAEIARIEPIENGSRIGLRWLYD